MKKTSHINNASNEHCPLGYPDLNSIQAAGAHQTAGSDEKEKWMRPWNYRNIMTTNAASGTLSIQATESASELEDHRLAGFLQIIGVFFHHQTERAMSPS